MWKYLANKILRNKIAFITVLGVLTLFMGYHASKIELSYAFAQVLPDDDSTYIEYENFRRMFGEDGSVMVIGVKDSNFFQKEKFNDWYALSKSIKQIEGIRDLMSVARLYNVKRNDSLNKFDFYPIITKPVSSQNELDSIKNIIESLPFYEGLIYKKETGAHLMAITFTKKDLDSKNRISIVEKIIEVSQAFSKKHNIELHYSGMPYIRTVFMKKISGEMGLFIAMAVLVMAITLWLFFKSFYTVFYSIITVAIGVVWSLGTIHLFDYKITILSGLIGPLIMVIGIPNCVFLINKYHSEYALHKNKVKALSRMIHTVGVTLFLANVTTAIGFGVLYFTNSKMLVEFGVVAALNVMVTYCITLILVPIILSFLKPPKEKHTKHLESKRINKILEGVDYWVQHKRGVIYITVALMTLIGFWGMTKINVMGYVVDDLPQKDPVYTDLRFFESNFNGVLPFEIAIDTKKDNGVFENNGAVLYKIKRLQKLFSEYKQFSKPLSIIEGIKFTYQAYEGGDEKYYRLPGAMELNKLAEYSSSVKGQENKLQNFIDSTKRIARVSFQMADLGSTETKKLVAELKPRIDSIFDPKEYNLRLTGHSLMFLKGNDYLLYNLYESLVIEILLIIIVGLALFRSVRIILLSKLPCLIPLVITAGIMGFLDIRFKPSTILIFSIAFGISSDGTIYLLAKYRQELNKLNSSIPKAISIAIKETGLSMFYTAFILFFGFAIFAASSFGGTVAMGVLISITLLVSMFTNLVLLPAILLSIDNRRTKKEMKDKPLIDINEEESD